MLAEKEPSISRTHGFSLLTIAAFLLLQSTSSTGYEQPVKQILDGMFASYDKGIRPNYGEKPVEVEVSVFVLSIQEINEQNMDFTLTMYLRQSWKDPRLSFRSQRGINMNGSNSTIRVSFADIQTEINLLPLINKNSISNDLPAITVLALTGVHDKHLLGKRKEGHGTYGNDNERVSAGQLIWFHPEVDKVSIRSDCSRYTMTFQCPMDLRHFPFDQQTCSIELESFSGTMNDIVYHMKDNASFGVSDSVSIPGFILTRQYVRENQLSLSAGNYSRISLSFVFQRAFGYYIIRCYIPIGTAVTVSLLSLLFANSAIGPLIHVVTICFVTWYSGQAWILKSPMISYLKSLDLYYFICLGHLLLCLFVSLASSYRQVNQGDKSNSVCSICKPLTELDPYRGGQSQNHNPRRSRSSSCNAGTIIFCCLKWVVVFLFVASNVMYWLFYRYVTIAANKKYEQAITFS